jgi:hypothetical protein
MDQCGRAIETVALVETPKHARAADPYIVMGREHQESILRIV